MPSMIPGLILKHILPAGMTECTVNKGNIVNPPGPFRVHNRTANIRAGCKDNGRIGHFNHKQAWIATVGTGQAERMNQNREVLM